MVENIPTRIRHWKGKTNHIRCFNHIINLIVKTLLKLFEVPKGKRDPSGKTELDEAEAELERLGKDLEVKDLKTQVEDFHNTLTAEGSDNDEDVIDATELLDTDELADFRESIVPIRLALTKVCVVCLFGELVLILINCSCSTLSRRYLCPYDYPLPPPPFIMICRSPLSATLICADSQVVVQNPAFLYHSTPTMESHLKGLEDDCEDAAKRHQYMMELYL
jgi:hypothetical protein